MITIKKKRPAIKLSFVDKEQRDKSLIVYPPGTYKIDTKNPLVVWVEC